MTLCRRPVYLIFAFRKYDTLNTLRASEHFQCNNNYFFHIVYFWSSLYVAVAVFSIVALEKICFVPISSCFGKYISLYFCSKNVYCLFVNEIEYFLGILIAIPIQVLASYAQPYTL